MAWLKLNTVKQWLQVSHTAEDDALHILVEGAEAFVSRQTGIHLSTTTPAGGEEFTEDLDGGGYALRPEHLPVRSVSEILDTEDDNEEVTEDYKNTTHRIVREDEDKQWASGTNRWRTTYKGGYGLSDTDPEVGALKWLILQLCYHAYHGRGDEASGPRRDFRSLAQGDSEITAALRRLSLKMPFA